MQLNYYISTTILVAFPQLQYILLPLPSKCSGTHHHNPQLAEPGQLLGKSLRIPP
jgi:hypothetical protein